MSEKGARKCLGPTGYSANAEQSEAEMGSAVETTPRAVFARGCG
jgi:hypothetical protein